MYNLHTYGANKEHTTSRSQQYYVHVAETIHEGCMALSAGGIRLLLAAVICRHSMSVQILAR